MKAAELYTIIDDNPDFVAVNKSSGLSVGGDRWDDSVERLDKLLERSLGIPKIFTVHRIDKETSGLVVFAKEKEKHRELSLAFENRQVKKRYLAIVQGRPSWKEIECDLALVPNGNKKHMTIIDKFHGKPSLTRFILVCSAGNYSVLEIYPETGRIHQIRVHAAALGHPVVCDVLYGSQKAVKLSSFKRGYRGDPFNERPLLSRLGLHAHELTLPGHNPLIAPLPKDMNSLIKQMKKASGKINRNLPAE
jgi:RluA family pseudouridine synthase